MVPGITRWPANTGQDTMADKQEEILSKFREMEAELEAQPHINAARWRQVHNDNNNNNNNNNYKGTDR